MKLRRSICLLFASLFTFFAFLLSGASCAYAEVVSVNSDDTHSDRLIIGFKQVVCEAACPFDPRGANCTTQTFRIGDCVPTSEDGWYALVVDCEGPDLPPRPPTPKPSIWPRLSNNHRKPPQNDGEESVVEGGRGRGQLFALDSRRPPPPPKASQHDNEDSTEDSIIIKRKKRRAPLLGAARPPIPPHITIRYVHNANTTYNKSTSCRNSNETKLSKEAVGRCFALNTDDSEEDNDEGGDRSDGSFSGKGQRSNRNRAFSWSRGDGPFLGRAAEDEGSAVVPFYSRRIKQLSSGRGEEVIGDDDANDLTFDAKDEAFERDAKEKFLSARKAAAPESASEKGGERERGTGDSYSLPEASVRRFFAVNYCYSIKVKK